MFDKVQIKKDRSTVAIRSIEDDLDPKLAAMREERAQQSQGENC